MKFGAQTPGIGTERKRMRSAWFPTRMTNGVVIWLEFYHETQRWERRVSIDPMGIPYEISPGWFTVKREIIDTETIR